ncbi:MAG: hypothetical protein Q8Q60_02150 [Candidatus Chromulinivorax sp.]|nr:hypothetical protein [Candidatus Chromulinivorax sp.]
MLQRFVISALLIGFYTNSYAMDNSSSSSSSSQEITSQSNNDQQRHNHFALQDLLWQRKNLNNFCAQHGDSLPDFVKEDIPFQFALIESRIAQIEAQRVTREINECAEQSFSELSITDTNKEQQPQAKDTTK